MGLFAFEEIRLSRKWHARWDQFPTPGKINHTASHAIFIVGSVAAEKASMCCITRIDMFTKNNSVHRSNPTSWLLINSNAA